VVNERRFQPANLGSGPTFILVSEGVSGQRSPRSSKVPRCTWAHLSLR